MSDLAPIAIFSFRRPRHLAATLDALQRCPEFSSSEVIVYSDGARRPSDESGVNEVRQLLRARKTQNMTIVERQANVGLANSIIGAVTEITDRAGRVIIVEDDLVFQPTALTWLNAGLAAYADDSRVMQIGAYQYRVPEFEGRSHGTFQRFTTTWGWATWKRAWDRFDPNALGWEAIRDDPDERVRFDSGGVYPFSEMLLKQMAGKIDSWGIRWFWSAYKAGGLSLMPPRSLVTNNGFDAGATHNTLGSFKRLALPPAPRLWLASTPPQVPAEVALISADEVCFRRALLNTHAMRNSNIKKVLVRMGFKQFA